jgi:hypothetical protein
VDAAQCVPAHEAAGLARDGWGWLEAAGESGRAYLADDQEPASLMVQLLGGDDAGPGGTVAAELVREAGADLLQRLVGGATVAAAMPPAACWDRASGAAFLSLPVQDCALVLLLDPACTARLLERMPRPRRAQPALADPRSCIGHTRVELRIWLGAAELELALFQTLAVNDVIQLDGRIDEPLRLSVAGHATTRRGFLGQRGGRKAVRLTSHH